MIYRSTYISQIESLIQNLSKDQIKLLSNGVGSNKPVLRWFKPPVWICQTFAEAAKFHDVAYWIGGLESERRVVDHYFDLLCFDLTENLGFFSKLYALFWLLIDSYVLKIFGAVSFRYRAEPCFDIEILTKETKNDK